MWRGMQPSLRTRVLGIGVYATRSRRDLESSACTQLSFEKDWHGVARSRTLVPRANCRRAGIPIRIEVLHVEPPWNRLSFGGSDVSLTRPLPLPSSAESNVRRGPGFRRVFGETGTVHSDVRSASRRADRLLQTSSRPSR